MLVAGGGMTDGSAGTGVEVAAGSMAVGGAGSPERESTVWIGTSSGGNGWGIGDGVGSSGAAAGAGGVAGVAVRIMRTTGDAVGCATYDCSVGTISQNGLTGGGSDAAESDGG